jgi:tetratricopeptide (TPR) repeat protein
MSRCIIRCLLFIYFRSTPFHAVNKMRTIEELEAQLSTEIPPLDRIKVLLELKNQLRGKDFDRGRALSAEAVQLASQEGEPLLEAGARRHLGTMLWRMGRNTEAQDELTKSLRIAQEHSWHEGLAHAYCVLGIVHGSLNDSANALVFFENALQALEHWGDEAMEAHVLGNIGQVHFSLGDYPTALRFMAKSLAISRELGQEGLYGVANMLTAIAGVLVEQGEFDKAIAHLEEGIRIDRETDDQRGTAVKLLNIGITSIKAGNMNQAFDYLNRSLELGKKIHYKATEHMVHEHLAEAYRSIGEHEKALEHMSLYHELMLDKQRAEVRKKADTLL